jgi:plastocyanin
VAKTTRRDLLKVAGAGSLAAGLGITDVPAPKSEKAKGRDAHEHKQGNAKGAHSNATVSFGAWPTDPPLDRFPNLGQPPKPNVHELIPFEAKIKAGESVNFIIAGFHQVLVYDDGTVNTDIDTSPANLLVRPMTAPLITYSTNRIYRGLDPLIFPQDRVEVVYFEEAGRYLVICGVLPHFLGGMFGYVKVTGKEKDE